MLISLFVTGLMITLTIHEYLKTKKFGGWFWIYASLSVLNAYMMFK